MEQHTLDRHAAMAKDLYGPLAVFRGIARSVYDAPIREAKLKRHELDAKALEGEQEQFAQLLNFLEMEVHAAKEFANIFRRYAALPLNHPVDADRIAAQKEATFRTLENRHGVLAVQGFVGAAHGAYFRVVKHWPGLTRLLTVAGAGNDPEVIEVFAALAKSKGWG